MVEMKYPETKFNLESPGGLVNVRAQCKENQVENVIVQNQSIELMIFKLYKTIKAVMLTIV